MTLPLSGTLEASDINVELGRSATATFSVTDAVNGVYGAINTCSLYYPNSVAPHAYSEWYGYDHNATCSNSNFAFSPVEYTPARFLRSDTLNYSTKVSTNSPSPNSTFSFSFWMKVGDSNIDPVYSYQGYIAAINDRDNQPPPPAPSTQNFAVDWFGFLAAPYGIINRIFFSMPGLFSSVNLSDPDNSPITGFTDAQPMGEQSGNPNLGPNGYFLISVIVDYANIGTDDYVQWYFNESRLVVPYYASTPPPGTFSGTVPDNPQTLTYSSLMQLKVGANYEGEVSCGCLLDGFAFWPDTAITFADVQSIYNGGAFAPTSTYQSAGSRLLFYNFEIDTPGIGTDTGNYYDFTLDEINGPARVLPPAP
jgi:hypothetical protein